MGTLLSIIKQFGAFWVKSSNPVCKNISCHPSLFISYVFYRQYLYLFETWRIEELTSNTTVQLFRAIRIVSDYYNNSFLLFFFHPRFPSSSFLNAKCYLEGKKKRVYVCLNTSLDLKSSCNLSMAEVNQSDIISQVTCFIHLTLT